MNKATLSIAIATYNEENNISSCLKAVSWADEIVIVDGQSSDHTVALAQKYKAKIISTENKPMFHLNKQMAIDTCQSDWILQLDADEIVSPALKKEIQDILLKPVKNIIENGFRINRSNFFLTRFLKKGGQYPDPVFRLYKRGQGRLPCLSVHEKTVINPPIGQLKNDLLHYADTNFSRYLSRNNRYTTLMSQNLIDNKTPLNFVTFLNYLFLKPSLTFFQIYFRHLGFLDGFPGLVFAYYSAISHQTAFVKYFQTKKRL
ncbi:glycosyltransferase family 2 protein [Patescibacteria group bacterium]|nr:glycosyltransferase family 2 protein [Patescibacteria group bacterium]